MPEQSATRRRRLSKMGNLDAYQDEKNGDDKSDEELQNPNYPSSEFDDEQQELPDPSNNNAASSVGARAAAASPDFLDIHKTFKRELGELDVVAANSSQLNRFLVKSNRRIFEDSLHIAMKRQAEELKGKSKAQYKSQKQPLQAAVENLSELLEKKTQEVEAAQREVAELEAEKKSLVVQLAEKDTEVEILVDIAREEGRRKTINDFNTSIQGDLAAFQRSHLEQLSKVRADYYREGFDAGRKAASPATASKPLNSSNQVNQVSIDVEALKISHEVQRELAQSPHEQTSILKRQRTEDKVMPEQPKRQKANSRQWLPQRVTDVRQEEAEGYGSEEIIGSMICVDTQSYPDVKGEEYQEEDLYGATPPPRAMRRSMRFGPL